MSDEQQHTPAPWLVKELHYNGHKSVWPIERGLPGGIGGDAFASIADVRAEPQVGSTIEDGEGRANAERIVECVNLCRGTPTEEVAGLNEAGITLERLKDDADQGHRLYHDARERIEHARGQAARLAEDVAREEKRREELLEAAKRAWAQLKAHQEGERPAGTSRILEELERAIQSACQHEEMREVPRVTEGAQGHGHPSGPAPPDHIQVAVCMECGMEWPEGQQHAAEVQDG